MTDDEELRMTGEHLRVTIPRAELVRIIDEASRKGVSLSARDKYLRVANNTPAVAAGWWHCDGAGCPSRQSHQHNQEFQKKYDELMADRYSVSFAAAGSAIHIEVLDAD